MIRTSRWLPALAATLALAGCVGDKAEYVHSVWRGPDARAAEQKVFFVTDRMPDKDWPGGFGKHWRDGLSCGTAVAVIPPLNLPDQPVPTGHLGAVTDAACGAPGDADGIASAMTLEAKSENCDRVLIYVHGFNTLFDGAVLRAAQLALDTRWTCPVAAFSWSSEGETGRYVADIEHSAYAAPELEFFLRALDRQGLRVDVIAHSIGARLILSALASMDLHGDGPRAEFIDQMVLTAADVGADTPNNDFFNLVNDARPFVRRTTVYASASDAVLAVAAVAHGNVPRAGHRPVGDRNLETGVAGKAVPQLHVVDVIDASAAPAELLGHSYFGLSFEAVSDVALALRGVPVDQRLAKNGDWPATLTCEPHASCQPNVPHYVLRVAPERRPDLWVRLVRWLAPLVPRIELVSLTGAPQ